MTFEPQTMQQIEDEANLHAMRGELAHDLTVLFHGDEDDEALANLDEWLESLQLPESVAKEAATAAAAVMLAFERGYRMSQAEPDPEAA